MYVQPEEPVPELVDWTGEHHDAALAGGGDRSKVPSKQNKAGMVISEARRRRSRGPYVSYNCANQEAEHWHV